MEKMTYHEVDSQFLNETVKIIYISMVQKEGRLIHPYVSFIKVQKQRLCQLHKKIIKTKLLNINDQNFLLPYTHLVVMYRKLENNQGVSCFECLLKEVNTYLGNNVLQFSYLGIIPVF